MKALEHEVRFQPGHDCIKFNCKFGSTRCIPGEGGSHGVHGLNICFYVKGEHGAVQFIIYTGWLPQQTTMSYIDKRGHNMMPADLGYHSKKPIYEDQTPVSEKCEFCDDAPCYYDGSSLNAHDAMFTLVNGGDAALWNFLEEYYNYVFLHATYPDTVEYPMALRSQS